MGAIDNEVVKHLLGGPSAFAPPKLRRAERDMIHMIRSLQRQGLTVPPKIWIHDPRSQSSVSIDTSTCQDSIDKEAHP